MLFYFCVHFSKSLILLSVSCCPRSRLKLKLIIIHCIATYMLAMMIQLNAMWIFFCFVDKTFFIFSALFVFFVNMNANIVHDTRYLYIVETYLISITNDEDNYILGTVQESSRKQTKKNQTEYNNFLFIFELYFLWNFRSNFHIICILSNYIIFFFYFLEIASVCHLLFFGLLLFISETKVYQL